MAAPAKTHPIDGEIVVPEAHNYSIRNITPAELFDALRLGYEDFKSKPSHLFVLGFVYPIGVLFVVGAALDFEFLPLVVPIAGGFALLGPFAAVVLYEISRRREKGIDFNWGEVGSIFRGSAAWSIFALAAALFLFFGMWLVVAESIFQSTIGYAPFASPGEFLQLVFTTEGGVSLILIGNGVGFLFAVTVLATNVVSFPIVLDRNVGPAAAVATSLRVTLKNPLTILIWGLIIAGFMAAGFLMFLIGLGIVIPVLGHATWHVYRKAVGP